MKLQKERLDFRSWDGRSRSYPWQKRIWMKGSEFCKQAKTDEAGVHHSPTDAASIRPWWSSSSRWERHAWQQIQALQEESWEKKEIRALKKRE